MKLYTSASVTLLFSSADAFFGFVFYLHWNDFALFGKDVFNYDFTHATFELWLFSMLRVVILVGATLGIIQNPKDGAKGIKRARYPVGLMNIVMILYVMAKIMLYTEYIDGNHDDDPWFLTLGIWTMVASLSMYGLWVYILQEARPSKESTLHLDDDARGLINQDEINERSCSSGSDTSSDNESDDSSGDDEVDGDDDDDIIKKAKKKKKSVKWYSSFLRLMAYSKADWPFLLVGFIALSCAAGGEVFIPLLTGQVLDGVIIESEKAKFRNGIISMTFISLGIGVANGVRGGSLSMAMARLNQRITNHLFESILKQELGFFDKTRTGAITSRLTSDTSTLSSTLSHNLNICLRSILQMTGYVVLMMIISWRLTFITLISFPLIAVITDVFGSYYEKLSRKVQTSLANANIVAEETISSMKTVRSFANEEGERKSYWNKLHITYLLRKKEAVAYGLFTVISSVCDLMVFVVTLFYGGHLVVQNMLSGGMLLSFIIYQLELSGCIEDLADVYTELMKAAGASRKVFQLIDRKPTFMNEGRRAPRQFEGQLEFKNVSFAYPTRPSIPVLKDVSFTASPGEVLALVGPSGGGKSSCISLIEHFYEPSSGEVLIDGRNVKEYDHAFLHQKIALVGQEPVLYARSIQDNISYSLQDCSTESIESAAKQANAHNFIMHLRKGYKTETGEKGLQLSGGQKQRVAIARALVRNPQMLLLDEATSALDAESEHLVQQALTKNFGTRTVVIVAHRLSTVEKADRIVVIDQGTVVEQGRHQELIKFNGLYARLVQRQLLGHDSDDGQDDKERLVARKNLSTRRKDSSASSNSSNGVENDISD
ncbi:ATP-binding cassette sub-family B member 9-like [Lytechinus variegatus]|uniref:ATP-binding cassette sub-family B member 9-like n=1 Tax=Lytechinus variegatus TaxID=7654 RepID=UPI001BB2CDA3|nr:ATP-binding cassette sub-family B member 9-like [Lytechinus variegatus]